MRATIKRIIKENPDPKYLRRFAGKLRSAANAICLYAAALDGLPASVEGKDAAIEKAEVCRCN
jgi:hypothetical protein